MKMKTYKDQDKEIQELLKSISKKSKTFAKADHNSPHYDDLYNIISELKDIDNFLK